MVAPLSTRLQGFRDGAVAENALWQILPAKTALVQAAARQLAM